MPARSPTGHVTQPCSLHAAIGHQRGGLPSDSLASGGREHPGPRFPSRLYRARRFRGTEAGSGRSPASISTCTSTSTKAVAGFGAQYTMRIPCVCHLPGASNPPAPSSRRWPLIRQRVTRSCRIRTAGSSLPPGERRFQWLTSPSGPCLRSAALVSVAIARLSLCPGTRAQPWS